MTRMPTNMNYFTRIFLGLIFSLSLLSFRPIEKTLTVTCELENCGPKLKLFQFDGAGFREIQESEGGESGFIFKIPASEPTFYYIGKNRGQVVPLILGTEDKVKVSGSCAQIRTAKINNSPINQEYQNLKNQINEYKKQMSQHIRQLRSAKQIPEKEQEILAKLKQLDQDKLTFLDSLKQNNPFFGRIVALNTYLSYQNNQGEYKDEIAYFAGEYFRHVDFQDKAYEKLPWVFEAFKGYTMTLSRINLPNKLLLKYLMRSIQDIPTPSQTSKMALSGIITVLKQQNNPNFGPMAEYFISTFKEYDPGIVASLQKEIDQAKSFNIGGTPPDFAQATPEGEQLKLSDFRGKVLLVDFWASWCGPCRRENPNVVKLYKKYNAQGFEVLGVSLDRTKDKWLKAIKQDNLEWAHVSDLKGWKNEVAQLYSVRSIPHTILLDQEGKILARNLRGAALARKLEELFKNKPKP